MAPPEYLPNAAKRKRGAACDACRPRVSKANPFCVYGGAWKITRHKETSADADPHPRSA